MSLNDLETGDNEFNRFLRLVKVPYIHLEFVADNENSFWAIAVEFLPITPDNFEKENQGVKKSSVGYRELLSVEDFVVFAKLREWRKAKAAEEKIPVYVVLTNEQLAKIAEQWIMDQTALQKIDGIGEGRSSKYGDAVFEIVAAETLESGAKERA